MCTNIIHNLYITNSWDISYPSLPMSPVPFLAFSSTGLPLLSPSFPLRPTPHSQSLLPLLPYSPSCTPSLPSLTPPFAVSSIHKNNAIGIACMRHQLQLWVLNFILLLISVSSRYNIKPYDYNTIHTIHSHIEHLWPKVTVYYSIDSSTIKST